MQFKITLQVLDKNPLLSLNYQYELSSWVFKMIEKSDNAFSKFLHNQGYQVGNKRFKLFTFSNLYVPNFEIIDDRMKIRGDEISFHISFYVDQGAEALIKSLFAQETFSLGDRITQVKLQVKEIQLQDLAISKKGIRLKTLSPMVISMPQERGNGKFIPKYLHPREDAQDFERIFWQNLKDKYQSAVDAGLAEPMNWEEPVGKFLLEEGRIKSRLIRIKAHTPQETKVKGYMFNFRLEAPKELIRLGILAGFGEKGSQGFGATRILF